MFIAVTFICLIGGECKFIHDNTTTTEIECMERNERVAQILEADNNVAAYRGGCIPIPKGGYDARARNNP
jgi:hypothetical protein